MQRFLRARWIIFSLFTAWEFLALWLVTGAGAAAPPADCNANGVRDELDIAPSFSVSLPETIPSQVSASKVLAGDQNGDGRPEIVALSNASSQTLLYWNLGGHFSAPDAVPTVVYPWDLMLVDLFHDGNSDFISVGNWGGTGMVSVILTTVSGPRPAPAVTWPLSSNMSSPASVAAADLDGDHDIDLAVANGSEQGFVAVLLNSGEAAFRDEKDYAVARMPRTIRAADFDEDGDIDLAVSHAGESAVAILENHGDATFAPAKLISSQSGPLQAEDLQGDGTVDLIVGVEPSSSDTSISVIPNSPGVNLGPAFFVDVGLRPTALFLADLAHHGDLDLAITDASLDGLSIFEIGKNLTFQKRFAYSVARPSDVSGVDVDGDAAIDLLVVAEGFVSVLRNDGAGQLSAAREYATRDRSGAATPVDLDGDGRIDIVTVNPENQAVTVVKNEGGRSFSEIGTFTVEDRPVRVAAGDLDIDEHPDLVVTNLGSGAVSVLDGIGDGSFEAARSFSLGDSQAAPIDVAISDLNADGRLDMAVTDGALGNVVVFLGTGGGGFGTPSTYRANTNAKGIQVADLDGDADADLAVSNSILLNKGDGTFERKAGDIFRAGQVDSVAAADFDRDGHMDLAAAAGFLMVSWNDGKAGFGTSTDDLEIQGGGAAAIAVDLEGDGSADLLSARGSTTGNLSVVRYRGRRRFRPEEVFWIGRSVNPVATADLDSDGRPDIVLSGTEYPHAVHMAWNQSEPGRSFDWNHDGIPDECQVAFRRGDADGDGFLNITDPVLVLRSLFLDDTALPCSDAADVDDAGGVEVTDAVYSLRYQFLNGPPPPSPFPDCGTDPAPDGLGCRAYPGCP